MASSASPRWRPALAAEIAAHRRVGMLPVALLMQCAGLLYDVRSAQRGHWQHHGTRPRGRGCRDCRIWRYLVALLSEVAAVSHGEGHFALRGRLGRHSDPVARGVWRLPPALRQRWGTDDWVALLTAAHWVARQLWRQVAPRDYTRRRWGALFRRNAPARVPA